MIRITLAIAAALAVGTIVASAPAQASGTLTRTFVSSTGVDSNPCTVAQPCATFQTAYNAVAANGIVAALDPGKYGPLTITTGVTINGNGWAAITGPAGNNAITINANASNGDSVTLNGLEIDGAKAAYAGIVFNSGGSLTVTNCVVRNFTFSAEQTTGDGIVIQPASGRINVTIANTILSDNDYNAIWYNSSQGSAATTGVIDHVTAVNNTNGIVIVGAGESTTFTVSNSVISNSNSFILSDGMLIANAAVSIDNSNISGNGTGIIAQGTAKVLLGRSVITSNSMNSINNQTNPNTFYTYQNNQINLNGSNNQVANSALMALPFQ